MSPNPMNLHGLVTSIAPKPYKFIRLRWRNIEQNVTGSLHGAFDRGFGRHANSGTWRPYQGPIKTLLKPIRTISKKQLKLRKT